MRLSSKKKKLISKWAKVKDLNEIASELNITKQDILDYLKKIWNENKYEKYLEKFVNKDKKNKFDIDFKNWFKKRWKILLGLVLLVFAVYANSLPNQFVSDDIGAILTNPNVGNFDLVFKGLGFMANFLRYAVFTVFGLNPTAFRVENILSHTANVVALMFLIELMLGFRIALLVSLLFAVHPIQIESVTWISGGFYNHSALFLFLSLILFIKTFRDKKTFSIKYIFSIIFYLTAILLSQKNMGMPAILVVYLWSIKDLKKYWKKTISYFVIVIIFFVFYLSMFSQRKADIALSQGSETKMLNPVQQIPIALTNYFELIFYPKNLSLYHSEFVFTGSQFAMRLFLTLAIFGLIIFSLKKDRKLFFWFSFLIISLSPTLTPYAISWIVAERYIYTGVVGVFVIFAIFYERFLKNIPTRRDKVIAWIFFGLIIIALSTRTYFRNKDWYSHDTLWFATDKVVPNNYQNQNNLADYYVRHGNFEMSIFYLKRAIELNPGYAAAYTNLGLTYLRMENFEEAEKYLMQAMKMNPGMAEIYNNLGVIRLNQGRIEEAIQYFEKTLALEPTHVNAMTSLGMANQALGNSEGVAQNLKQAAESNPQNADAQTKFGLYLLQIKNYDLALDYLTRAINLLPKEPTYNNNLGLAYLRLNQLDKAKEYFEVTIKLDSNFAPAYTNLGELSIIQNDLTLAKDYFIKAINLDPSQAYAQSSLGKIEAQAGNFPEAEIRFKKVIELAPNSASGFSDLGALYLMTNNVDLAKENLNKALEINPSFIEPIFNLGLYSMNTGDNKTAIEQFEKVLIIDPIHAQATQYLEQLRK